MEAADFKSCGNFYLEHAVRIILNVLVGQWIKFKLSPRVQKFMIIEKTHSSEEQGIEAGPARKND